MRALTLLLCCGLSAPALAGSRMKEALEALAAGTGDLSAFSVTYTDLPNPSGGMTLTVRGDGKVEQEVVGQAAGKVKPVQGKELAQLAALLLELKVWEQHLTERRPYPDEGEARLTVRAKDTSSVIWEAHGNLAKNDRILRVRERLKQICWARRGARRSQ